MDKKELIKELKEEYPTDYLVLVDSVVFGLRPYVYGNKDIALEEHKRLTANCDLLKPCTVEFMAL